MQKQVIHLIGWMTSADRHRLLNLRQSVCHTNLNDVSHMFDSRNLNDVSHMFDSRKRLVIHFLKSRFAPYCTTASNKNNILNNNVMLT